MCCYRMGTHLNGVIASFMPAIDSVSQTQRVLVKSFFRSQNPGKPYCQNKDPERKKGKRCFRSQTGGTY